MLPEVLNNFGPEKVYSGVLILLNHCVGIEKALAFYSFITKELFNVSFILSGKLEIISWSK